MLEDILSKFGLSTKEAKIYIALLELGATPVSDLAKKAGIKRSTTYVLLGSLMNRGLVSITDRNSVRLYNPAPPERLVHYLEEASRKYSQLIGVAKSILPELKSVYTGVGPKPKVQFFEGYEGIETAYEDTLSATEEIRAYASINNMHAALPHYFPEYYKRRAAKNIKIRAIFPDTPESRERMKYNEIEKRDALLVPSTEYSLSPEINIYDNKIVFMSLVEKFSLFIESKELADAFKKAFELSWLAAKQLNTVSKDAPSK